MNRLFVLSVLVAVVSVVRPSGVTTLDQRLTEGAESATQTLLDRGLYEEAENLARARVDALAAASGHDPLELAAAADLLVTALLMNGRGASASTLALATQTLKLKEAQLGATHLDLTPSLLNLSDALVAAGDYRGAIETAQRAVTLRERPGDQDDLDLAQALDHLGGALTAASRNEDALIPLERSLRAKERALPDSDARIARTLEAIGWAQQRKGDYESSSATLRRAAAIQQEVAADHPANVETLNLLGLQLWFEGDLPKALELSTRAVELAERTLRPDHPTLARALRYQAGAFIDLGDLVRGQSLLERALGIADRTFGSTHHDMWAYLNDLACSEMYLGRYTAARGLFERALKVAEARLGTWNERVGTTMNNLALVDASLGDYANSRTEHLRASAIWEQVLGPYHPFVARAVMELGSVYREQGAPLRALPLLQRALAIRERSLGLYHRDVASTLADLAATLMQLGRITEAQTAAVRAVRIWERSASPEAREFAPVLGVYAHIQSVLGRMAVAREYYERALEIQEKALGRSHPKFADTQVGLATTLAVLGDRASAISGALEAERTGRNHLRLMLRYLPERQSLAYAGTRPRGLDLAMSLAAGDVQASDHVFDALVKGRALVLDEMAERRHVRTDASAADVAPLWTALTSARQRLANLVVRGPSDQRPEQYVKLVDDARREKELAERALAEKSATFREEQKREEIGLNDVRAALPPDSALVAFVKYDRTRFVPTAPASKTATAGQVLRVNPSYVAFILRADLPDIAMVPLGSAAAIDPLVARWHDEATNVLRISSAVEAERTYRVTGSALRQKVWDPLDSYLKNADKVFIVPDGALNLLSFAALPVGQARYLIESGPVIHYLSAERDLVAPAPLAGSARGLLAVGGAAFDDPTLFTRPRGSATTTRAARNTAAGRLREGCGDLATLNFPPLNATLEEVRDVRDLWTGSPVRVLEGRDASERAFKQDAPGRRVLHLATHGFFLGAKCDAAPGVPRAAGVPQRPAGEQQTAGTADNPLLLSGLALAGANHRADARAGDEDGILTAEEVASLNLEGVEWAVLSACDTGLGQVKNGEGVFGLRRAFQVAGVHTVIMSLWAVEDESTREWMTALYQGRLQRHMTTAEAVHNATLTVLRDRRAAKESTHPFYWGGFAAAGDWR